MYDINLFCLLEWILNHILLSATGCFSFTVITYARILWTILTVPNFHRSFDLELQTLPLFCIDRSKLTVVVWTPVILRVRICFFFFSIVASFFCYLLTWIRRFQRVLHDQNLIPVVAVCQIRNRLINFKRVHQRATVRHGLVASAGRRYSMPIPKFTGFHGLFVLLQKLADKQPRNPASPALTKKTKRKKCTWAQVHSGPTPTLPPICPLVTTATVWTQGTF